MFFFTLTLILLNPDVPCLFKQFRSVFLGPSWLSCLSVLKNYHSSELDWIQLTLLLLFCSEWASSPSLTKRPRSQTKIFFMKVLKIRDLYLQTVLMHDTWTDVSYFSEVLFLAIPIPSRFPSTHLSDFEVRITNLQIYMMWELLHLLKNLVFSRSSHQHKILPFQCLGLWPANYRIEKEQKSKESFLDPNHTHFILCDNGTEHRFAVEIPFRAKLENELAKIKTDTGDSKSLYPSVSLSLSLSLFAFVCVFLLIQSKFNACTHAHTPANTHTHLKIKCPVKTGKAHPRR